MLPCGGEVKEHVLDPGEIGVALGRGAVFPAGVVLEFGVPPFADIEGGIGHDEVGAEIGVLVAGKAVGGFLAEVEVDAADGHVHGGEAPGGGVALLAVDGEVAEFAAVGLDELLALDEEAAGAACGIVDAALVGLEHLDDEGDDGFRGEVLAAFFALGHGEFAEEILVNVAEDVLRVEIGVLEGDAGDEVDEADDALGGELELGVAFIEDVFELGVFFLDGVEGVVDELAGGGDLVGGFFAVSNLDPGAGGKGGAILEGFPAGEGGDPEDVFSM